MEKAGSFIHKPIYSSEATVAEEKNVRGKNYFEFIKLNNSTTPTILLHYVPLRHNSDFSEYSLHVFTFFFSFFCFPAYVRKYERTPSASFKRKQSIAERWKSQRLCTGLWMQPSQFGHTLLCLCVSFGVGVCAQTHALCVYIYMCVFVRVLLCAHACVCVQTGLINAAPPSGAMWVEWLVSTSWTFLTLSLLVSGELSTTFTLISSLWAECFCPIRSTLS